MTTAIDLAREHAEALQQRDAVIDGLESALEAQIDHERTRAETSKRYAHIKPCDSAIFAARADAFAEALSHLRALKNGEATEEI